MTHHGLKLGKEDMRGLRVSERGKGSVDLEPGSHYHIEPQEKQCPQKSKCQHEGAFRKEAEDRIEGYCCQLTEFQGAQRKNFRRKGKVGDGVRKCDVLDLMCMKCPGDEE